MSVTGGELMLIDVDDGTSRLGGNLALYKKLLQKFIDGNYTQAIETELAAGNMEAAVAAAHTIKGVAANLSLKRVNALALDLEQQLKNAQPYEETFTLLKAAAEDTVAEINAL